MIYDQTGEITYHVPEDDDRNDLWQRLVDEGGWVYVDGALTGRLEPAREVVRQHTWDIGGKYVAEYLPMPLLWNGDQA